MEEISPLNVEGAVVARYSAAANAREAALCCPVDYDPQYLKIIPEEVLERDYGCGDPSRYARPGDTVLDLGSGGGKICFIASQIVGPTGQVIGVDMNDEMLELARRTAPVIAERAGHANVAFRRGRIQDLALSADAMEAWLAENPVRDLAGMAAAEAHADHLRATEPMIPDDSVDVIVSNCVLNLVRDADKPALIKEMFRVLRRGGRIAISDIVSDEFVPASLKADPTLWSGCISGAFQEQELLALLEEAGFYGIAIDKWQSEPWQVVDGIEFRSVTVTAHKGKEGPCMEAGQAVIYRGPWREVIDDDGHTLRRGDRTAVCAKTYGLLTSPPYTDAIIGIQPATPIPPDEQRPFACVGTTLRPPSQTKGGMHALSEGSEPESCC